MGKPLRGQAHFAFTNSEVDSPCLDLYCPFKFDGRQMDPCTKMPRHIYVECQEEWRMLHFLALREISNKSLSFPYFNFTAENNHMSTVERVSHYLHYTCTEHSPTKNRLISLTTNPRLSIQAYANHFLMLVKHKDPEFNHFISTILPYFGTISKDHMVKYICWPLWASYKLPSLSGNWHWYQNIRYKL
ncbi:hypothetical protein DSO57_1029631 [Entomophthora muscae]|uniref:Uncharacterized protein n=1 Tax=Entomophthora muscae TaxID=34485 RepID=A0ACC2UAR7_9FUNG|nr:hypothetical protein DSO57_1029631 [Entomophthora muscae]